MDLSYSIIGFVVGFIVGLTGVGGGSLMTPALVLIFDVELIIAVGTDLLYAAITKSGGVWVHHRRGNIQWRIVLLLSIGSIPASLLAIILLKWLASANFDYEGLIVTTLSIALILTSIFLLIKNRLLQISRNEQFTIIKILHQRLCKPITICAGVLIGILVTLSSVGAGVIGAALLFILYPRLRAISIVGTDLAHAIPITAIAGLGHAYLGNVDYLLLAFLLIGSLPGIFLGSHIGSRLPDNIIRPILAVILLLIGIRLIL